MSKSSASRRLHPSWEEIKGFLDVEAPTLHVIEGAPQIALFFDPGEQRMGLRADITGKELPHFDPLAEIRIRAVVAQGRQIEVSTANKSLFPYFYAFALSLADRVQVEGAEIRTALVEAVDRWRNLLRQATLLADEKQTGLFGELWALDRLFQSKGQLALDAWTGPRGEAHDFRVGQVEIEIKTTRMERRVHAIGHLAQLVPSPGHSLFVLSLQFAAAGVSKGVSLAERIREVRARFEPSQRVAEFNVLLQDKYGITSGEEHVYSERLQLRTEPHLVPVTDEFPRLLPEDIEKILRPGMERVSDIRYRLNLDGLGFSEGTPEFLEVLPLGEPTG